MENYYQKEIECASPEKLREIQDERLVKQVKHVWDNVPYYRKKMEEKGVTPDDIKGVDDLHKLPFLSKADLRDAYPYGLLAAPLKDCVRIQSTSGTTGRRVVAFYTKNDIDLWEDCCARAIVAERMKMLFRLHTVTDFLQAAQDFTAAAIRSAVLLFRCPRATRTDSFSS